MNFTQADVAPEQQLNEAIWKSVKGADSPMPAPRGAPASGAEEAEEGGH
jgi:hypothetical protein